MLNAIIKYAHMQFCLETENMNYAKQNNEIKFSKFNFGQMDKKWKMSYSVEINAGRI